MARRPAIAVEIVPIGNSKGLRIPKGIREAVGLEGEVTLTITEGALAVRPKRVPRADWRERFFEAPAGPLDELLMPDGLGTDFDAEWTW